MPDVDTATGSISNCQIKQTVLLADIADQALNDKAPSATNVFGGSFDSKGFVIDPKTGNMFISDEYALVCEFDRNDKMVRDCTAPENINPTTALGVCQCAPDANTAGRRINRGFEGLATSPDGNFAHAMLQSATANEGGGNGVHNRIVKFDTATGRAVAQFAHKMEASSQGRGISALVAINDDEFLVLERNDRGLGSGAELTTQNKKVDKIDITGAADISGIEMTGGTFSGKTVTKTVTPFLDLGADSLAALRGAVPEKWEGLAIGPKRRRRSFLMFRGIDNDYPKSQIAGSPTQYVGYFKADTTNRIRCDIGGFANCAVTNANGTLGAAVATGFDTRGYALIPGVLHAYKASATDLTGSAAPVPEPPTYALMLAGLGAYGRVARRRSHN